MYKMKTRIRYSECGTDNKLKIPAIINYFQDTTTENSEQIGVGHAYLKGRKRAWILTSWQVEIMRRPETSEEVEICTWATGFKGILGPRDFCMQTPKGDILACAHSLWVYMDTETGRPVKPLPEEVAAYEVEPPLEMESVSRKIKFPETADVVDTFPIRKYHIDTNHHVNNSQYIQMAYEVIPEEYSVKSFRVEYRNAAVLGDSIVVKRVMEDERVVVGLCDEQENPYAIVEFIGEYKK